MDSASLDEFHVNKILYLGTRCDVMMSCVMIIFSLVHGSGAFHPLAEGKTFFLFIVFCFMECKTFMMTFP